MALTLPLLGPAGAGALTTTGAPCATLRCRCVPAAALGLSDTALVHRHRTAATAVFLGTVLRLDTLPGPPGPVRAIVRVARVWKGAVGDTAAVVLDAEGGRRSSCDATLVPRAEYVVFATPAGAGALGTRQCTGTAPTAGAEFTLAVLGAGHAPGRRQRP